MDEALLNTLFGEEGLDNGSLMDRKVVSIQTSSQLTTLRGRIGQSKFSAEIKGLYGNRCCFPGCQIADPRFLVGSHIARWEDNELLRGNLGNGLCLCLIHDKAFELGLFTLDENFCIFVNPQEKERGSILVQDLSSHEAEQINLAEIKPLEDALFEHWDRVGISM